MGKQWLFATMFIILTAIIILIISQGAYGVYTVASPIIGHPDDCIGAVRLAVIGDYGASGQPEKDVAGLVASWQVNYVVTVGDNNYPNGAASTIDANVGQYYHDYIYPYQGEYGVGARENRFFPALGNHDWHTESLQPYYDYFNLPGNERYYAVDWDSVHLFVVDSDPNEPDGRSVDSIQAQWLEEQMLASDAPWKLVAMHHSPYSSSAKHGSDAVMRWPFAAWGATAVLSGHDHTYERNHAEGIVYFVNGLGGRSLYKIGKAIPESAVRYNQDYGAMLINANANCINFSFISRAGTLIDSYTILNTV